MIRNTSNNYLKVVEWSAEDKCFVGTALGLIIGGVHGKSQEKVFKELCITVEEAISILHKEGKPLPPETVNKDFSGKISLRIPPALHKKIAIKAQQKGESINRFIQEQLEGKVRLN